MIGAQKDLTKRHYTIINTFRRRPTAYTMWSALLAISIGRLQLP